MRSIQLKKYIRLIVLLAVMPLGLGLVNCSSAPPDRPNIILILADDMGYADLGCTGSEISTPNLDHLAANGLLMTKFYNAGRCCPTRASLLTGLYQHQAGVGDMTGNRGVPAYQGYLNKQCITLAEALKSVGYATVMTGKWHVGDEPENWPQRRGFDNFYGIPQGGGAYFYPFLVNREVWENDHKITPDADFYSTDAFSEYAVKFIGQQQKAKNPFFLYVPYVAPHFPLQAKAEDIAKYTGKYKAGFEAIRQQRFERQKKSGIIKASVILSPRDELVKEWNQLTEAQKDTLDLKMAVYAAQVESMDRGIGKIMQKLKESGQLNNTLVLFLSDNGAESATAYPVKGASGPIGSGKSWISYGPSWANVSNTPFRLYKGRTYEGGIITPLIAHYPKLIKAGQTDWPGHIIDIMPTLLELAGAEYPKQYNGRELIPITGKSLLPVFKGEDMKPDRILYWEHEGNRAVRQGDWKLVSRYPDNNWQLYNLSKDPTELADQSLRQPGRVKQLEKLYKEWAKNAGVMPWEELIHKK